MLRELLTTLMDCRRSGGEYLFAKGRFVLRGFSADPAFELSKCSIIKDSNTTTSGCAHGLFVKRYNRRGLWRTLKRTFQMPRSYECLASAIRLREAGIATPRVCLASRYYLITEALPADAVFLNQKPELAAEAIPLLAKMHAAGIYHGDLSLRNLYFLNGTYGVIDLDSVKLFSGGIPGSLRTRELARLISSCARVYAARGEQLEPSALENLTEALADRYREKSGVTLPEVPLKERIRYLVSRVRRR